MNDRVECSHCGHVNLIDPESKQSYSCERCKRQLAVCPQCRQPRPAGAVLCVHCGLDFRTGKKVVASPAPRRYGDLTAFPISPGEWLLTMKRSFLGIPRGTREFRVAGFDKVYYDTLDSLSLNVAPTAEPGETKFSLSALLPILNRLFVFLLCGGLALYLLVRFSGNSESGLLFEVGFLGPRDKYLRLKRSRDSAASRELAVWLSETLGLPLQRRDRRSSN